MLKFICNGMLGKLCRFLRLCGVDTAYSNEGAAVLLTARQQNRILLTRNTHLRGKSEIYFLDSSDPIIQCTNVILHFNLADRIVPFSRCIECNSELVPISKKKARDKIPYFTFDHFDEFSQCPVCTRVYWKGSHYKNMKKDINSVITLLNKES